MLSRVIHSWWGILRSDLACLDDALPSFSSLEVEEMRSGFESQVDFAAQARPLAAQISQQLRNTIESLGPLLRQARQLQQADPLLGRQFVAKIEEMQTTLSSVFLDEAGIGGPALERWIDILTQEAALRDIVPAQ